MIKPIYSKYDPEIDEWVHGLSNDDFEKVRQGYACSNCLEDFGGLYLERCPVCKRGNVFVEAPPEWRR